MNKAELIEAVLKNGEAGETKAQVERSVNALLDGIRRGLKKDGIVQLVGFGSFQVKQRKARTGRNPQTGEKIRIKASKTVGFRPGKALKDYM